MNKVVKVAFWSTISSINVNCCNGSCKEKKSVNGKTSGRGEVNIKVKDSCVTFDDVALERVTNIGEIESVVNKERTKFVNVYKISEGQFDTFLSSSICCNGLYSRTYILACVQTKDDDFYLVKNIEDRISERIVGVPALSALFAKCPLVKIKVKCSDVFDMSCMFDGCSELKSIDLSECDTRSTENMCYMFSGCSSLTEINLSKLKVWNVTTMRGMFKDCVSLKSLNLSSFWTSRLKNMRDMFSGCKSLLGICLSDNFVTGSVFDMSGMFRNCENLASLDLAKFKTNDVVDMKEMFMNCKSLENLDVSKFKTDKVDDMAGMFRGCENLTSLNLSGFETDKVSDMNSMFKDCRLLEYLKLDKFKTSRVRYMDEMFSGCESLVSLDLKKFNIENVRDMMKMFYNCKSLSNLILFDPKCVIENSSIGVTNMFTGCMSFCTIWWPIYWISIIIN